MIKPDKDWPRGITPPEPPPMRIGQRGDTIDRHGVRRKSSGSIRNMSMDTFWSWVGFTIFALCLAAVFAIGSGKL